MEVFPSMNCCDSVILFNLVRVDQAYHLVRVKIGHVRLESVDSKFYMALMFYEKPQKEFSSRLLVPDLRFSSCHLNHAIDLNLEVVRLFQNLFDILQLEFLVPFTLRE